ncbi:hypothetical protein ZIOFF_026766 [Zingiber officinale]|uniref:Uncharacterized protein n=1 Tax=Zingiber officinale TaxID=94328 RepID=A0A8J5GZY5_ZINOF|nr:hypothetical protein ZIOFF_026766 [Zingiber officinale]
MDVEAVPHPRSPPRMPDLCGRHCLQAQLLLLTREIAFLEEEIQSIEGIQPASVCCKEALNPNVCYFELAFILEVLLFYLPHFFQSDIREEKSNLAFGGGSARWWFASTYQLAALELPSAGSVDIGTTVDRPGLIAPLAVDAPAVATAAVPAVAPD